LIGVASERKAGT